MKKIIIIGINPAGAKYLPQALRNVGYEPIFILDPEDFAGDARDALRSCTCYPADIENWPEVLEMFAERPEITRGVDAISSLYDEKFPLTERIARTYGLHHPEPAFARLAAKAEVARLIPEFCPPTHVFAAADWATADPAAVGAESGGVVLKPSVQAGAVGLTNLTSRDTPQAVRDAIAASRLWDAQQQTWLLQAKIDGRLISLEGYVLHGKVRFIGFSIRGRIRSTEVSNLFPGEARLGERIRVRCTDAVTALVERAGMRNGYFHCEFIATEDSAYLIDANVGRIVGGSVVEQIALSHGLTPYEIFGHVITLGLGAELAAAEPAYLAPELARPTMSFFYGLEGGGLVKSIALPPDTTCMHTQVTPDGAEVLPVGVNDDAWVGMLTGFLDEAVRDMDRIRIETLDGPRRAAYVVAG
ncbi:MAG TPA: ATP-grasp domain-containing protein [Actinophytocola sp.]|uniref:ATP-grasp domain-containing protein n=1 Tax=Actinophytocola sp. TaxID=1872138 RepID=UPI002DDDA350|nr:ATP-grasp domain-containing protein [Actinophytocola sp.]HEV2780524.1 ATP-grasp domain-containing protein [Actinophytocola sp.]